MKKAAPVAPSSGTIISDTSVTVAFPKVNDKEREMMTALAHAAEANANAIAEIAKALTRNIPTNVYGIHIGANK